ncbi:cytochrome P450 [Mycena leptocephala]|nr:cytochrome P450 [Mycena leptocephala]
MAKYLASQLGSGSAQRGLEIDHDIFGVLLAADSDTTRKALTSEEIANTIGFGLLELARNPELQEILRAEIHSAFGAAGFGNIAYDRMPLLNAFIKEALRFYPSIISSTGGQISRIRVRKGQIVLVGIASYQRLESRWGEDAHQFRPSRWLDGTVSKGEAIGPYANLLTFLGSPHTCLG